MVRNDARADRNRAISRLEQLEAQHESELAATEQVLSRDLQAQEKATRGVEQALKRKEAMIERRDAKLKDADGHVRAKLLQSAEETTLLLAEMEQLSLNLELKHTELAIKDGAIDKLTADLEAKDEQCISVSVELVKTLQAKRNQYKQHHTEPLEVEIGR